MTDENTFKKIEERLKFLISNENLDERGHLPDDQFIEFVLLLGHYGNFIEDNT